MRFSRANMRKGRSLTVALALCCLFVPLFALPGAIAAPFLPSSDDQVLDTLSPSMIALSRELHRNSDGKAAGSTNPPTTEALEHQLLDRYRIALTSQDPRAYGNVLRVLETWPINLEKTAQVHLVHAGVLQHSHAFDDALAELEQVFQKNPQNDQALLMRAQIGLVMGDYQLAMDSCEQLQLPLHQVLRVNCELQVKGVTGHAKEALQTFNEILSDPDRMLQDDKVEIYLSAADISHRLGESDLAQSYYRIAVSLSPYSPYALAHLGQLLLEKEQPEDLIALLQQVPESSLSLELKVLRAQAWNAVRESTPADTAQAAIAIKRSIQLNAELEEYFTSSRLRGEAFSYKEFALYALEIADRPADALQAAKLNWAHQKEPSDTLLLARAALATGNTELLTTLESWTDGTGTEDVRLQQIYLTTLAVQP